MVGTTIAITLLMSKPIGQLFKLERRLGLAIGIGTMICSSAAIAATKDIIDADETQAGLGVAVLVIGTLGIFLLPNIWNRSPLHLNRVDNGFMLSSTACSRLVDKLSPLDSRSMKQQANYATIVKMGRVLMLTPNLHFTSIV